MAGSVAELKNQHGMVSDEIAKNVAYLWDQWNSMRQPKLAEWNELRDYIFATDTSTTSNAELGWKNSTTIPKLCQIRDNLHANYVSTLFPNRRWLRWEGSTEDDEAMASSIEAFMRDLLERSNFYKIASQLLYDYIDYGNVFATVRYVRESYELEDGTVVPGYEGPKAVRTSPYDIVFNPVAEDFESSPKIRRSILTIGEILRLAEQPSYGYWREALDKSLLLRKGAGNYTTDDYNKALGYSVDGFGDLREYYGSDYVEVLEFTGDYHDREQNRVYKNHRIIVIDRCIEVISGPNPSWAGNRHMVHAPWRKRPDNLYGMGPLDNLVGMQYRIDHLENLKADAMDLIVHPILLVRGDVDQFDWKPGEQILIPGEGTVEELGKNLSGVVAANNEIAMLESKMEEFAGAPKQAMGIRTPGEKTAYEVQSLEAAASRIFQEKITNFEIHVLEPLLNMLLSEARQYVTGAVTLRVHDTQLDLENFMTLQPEDLNGNGTLRPRGARHFGEQAVRIQNLTQLFSSPIGEMLKSHTSTEMLSKAVEELLDLDDFKLFRRNQGLTEDAERMELAGNLEQVIQQRQAAPPPGG